MTSLRSRTSSSDTNATAAVPGRNIVAVLSSGSTMTTRGTPRAKYRSIFCRISPGRSSGDSTSMTRSGAPVKNPRGPRDGTRSFFRNAMSGPLTVSGFDASLKPISVADHADRMLLEMTTEEKSEPHHDSTVVEIDRAHANEPAFHQFVPVVVVRQSFQLFGGDQARVGHRWVDSHGILASSLPEPCRADSRTNQRESARMLDDVRPL